MPADTFDPILGLILQGTGNNNNSWGTQQNNFATAPTARAIGGVHTITATGGTVDLSGSPPPTTLRQDIDAIQLANGALTSDLTIIVPNLSKLWWFQNNTTGAFNMFVKTTAGTATQIPQGVGLWVMGDGNNNVIRSDKAQVGSFQLSAKGSAGFGELACNGASLLKAEFPDLSNAIGTNWGSADGTHFTLPNFTDTGRFLRSSSGSLSVGTYQSNQNAAHTHTVTGAPSAGTLGTDSQGAHTHSSPVTDPGHTHSIPSGRAVAGDFNNGGGGGGAFSAMGNGGISAASNTTGISVTIGSAGAHTHNITGAPGIGSLATASQGGSEARPEAAVVLMCIRY
jgi:microcystin-dependent protein